MTELTPIVIALAALVSAVFGVLHGNFAALFNLLSPIISLRGVDFTKLKADLVALSPADLSSLESTFNASLSIPDPAMLARVVGAGSALEGAVIFGEQVVAQVTSLYAQGVSLVAQVKAVFAPAPVGVSIAGITLPSWMTWLIPVLTTYVLPALAAVLPAEAAIINDVIALLRGVGTPAQHARVSAAWSAAKVAYQP